MYSAPPISATSSMNGIGGGMIDGSGTINPAALNTSVPVLSNSSSIHNQINPRGQKRSRSPEQSGDPFGTGTEDDDLRRKKRGRPPKSKLADESPTSTTSQQATENSPDQLRTPLPQTQGQLQDTNSTPAQTTPPKLTPAKPPIVKALPTVRDHTTDVLTPEQDEYIARETDEKGEQKVTPTGHPLGGREFKMRTFLVAHRGEKQFMLATECARVLGYRDSYLLFNKNRSLYKIIATQQEKDELIHQEILPYSYRSRQIAIVTAKSMFRQFGARVIEGGRRVRDDYWENKAIKQGFTEEDMAGDKRPGAAKAREATAAMEANNSNSMGPLGYGPQHDVIYAPAILENPVPASHGLPMMNIPEDSRLRAYTSISRPRQEISGIPYLDRTQSTPVTDVRHQASNAAELNKQISQRRATSGKFLEDHWNRERDPPVSTPQQQKAEQSPVVTQSPHLPSSGIMQNNPQSMLPNQGSQMMSPQTAYAQQPSSHQQNPHARSPGRSSMPSPIRPEIQHQQRPSVSYPSQSSSYGYHPNQMWGHPPPQPQPHQSPISSHHPSLPHYSPTHPPTPLQIQHHPSQSPHPPHSQPPQLHHSQSSSNIHSGGGLNYQNMAGGMPASASSYNAATGMGTARAMYPPQPSVSPSHAQQQYMQQQQAQTTAAQQAGIQGWAPPPQPGGYGYPASSGY